MAGFLHYFSYFAIFFFFYCEAKPYDKLFKKNLEQPKSSIKGIDGIYVINLDVRPEKWHRIEPILYFYNIDHIRFPAIFGFDFDIPTILEFGARHLRMGALGCMLSHLSIYQDALQKGLSIIWILEDDTEILRDPKLLTSILQELNKLDPNWDILYTDLDFVKSDGTYVRSLDLVTEKMIPPPHTKDFYTYRENISKNLQLIRSRFGTTSMLLSSRGMKKNLEHFTTHNDIVWPYDIEIHLVPNIRQYGIINPLATNGHFSFNYSDTSKQVVSQYYQIDDTQVKYMQEKEAYFANIIKNWFEIFKLPSRSSK